MTHTSDVAMLLADYLAKHETGTIRPDTVELVQGRRRQEPDHPYPNRDGAWHLLVQSEPSGGQYVYRVTVEQVGPPLNMADAIMATRVDAEDIPF